MRTPAKLHVVAADANDPRSPEDMLGFLFAREAQLTADLVDLGRQLHEQRVRYSKAHNLTVYAGVDTLRRRFGPEARS